MAVKGASTTLPGWSRSSASVQTARGPPGSANGGQLASPDDHTEALAHLREGDGRVLGPVATIRDVTKRFQREKETARRLKELEAKVQG